MFVTLMMSQGLALDQQQPRGRERHCGWFLFWSLSYQTDGTDSASGDSSLRIDDDRVPTVPLPDEGNALLSASLISPTPSEQPLFGYEEDAEAVNSFLALNAKST